MQRGPKDAGGKVLFHVKELEWFCQNAYNLGLKHASDWDLRSIARILIACSTLISKFPEDITAELASDLLLRSIFCNFLTSSALVALARAEDNQEQQLQNYLAARGHIAEADKEIQLQLQSKNVDQASAKDLLGKLAQLLALDFEAAVALKKYPDLGEIVLKAEQCQDLETYKMMADCALRSQLHPEGMRLILDLFGSAADNVQSSLAFFAKSSIRSRTLMNRTLRNWPNTPGVFSRSPSRLMRASAVDFWTKLAGWRKMLIESVNIFGANSLYSEQHKQN